MRKVLAIALTLVAVAALLTVVGGPTWAQKGPVKVGLLVPQTGPLAANGKDMINGLQLFFEEQSYRLAGREVKLIIEDDEGKPATGLTKARGLVEGQGVHLITGPVSAAVGYAIAPYVDSKKIATIFPIVAADDITQRKRSKLSIPSKNTTAAVAGWPAWGQPISRRLTTPLKKINNRNPISTSSTATWLMLMILTN